MVWFQEFKGFNNLMWVSFVFLCLTQDEVKNVKLAEQGMGAEDKI